MFTEATTAYGTQKTFKPSSSCKPATERIRKDFILKNITRPKAAKVSSQRSMRTASTASISNDSQTALPTISLKNAKVLTPTIEEGDITEEEILAKAETLPKHVQHIYKLIGSLYTDSYRQTAVQKDKLKELAAEQERLEELKKNQVLIESDETAARVAKASASAAVSIQQCEESIASSKATMERMSHFLERFAFAGLLDDQVLAEMKALAPQPAPATGKELAKFALPQIHPRNRIQGRMQTDLRTGYRVSRQRTGWRI